MITAINIYVWLSLEGTWALIGLWLCVSFLSEALGTAVVPAPPLGFKGSGLRPLLGLAASLPSFLVLRVA
jgi:hypothetical protein